MGLPFATTAAAVTGLQLVTGPSPFDSSYKSTTASCPAGKRLTGGGAGISGTSGQVVMDDLTPNSTLTANTLTGFEDENGYANSWNVTSYGICFSELSRVSATSATDSSNKFVTATCPSGKQVLGTGADISGGHGQVVMNLIFANSALTTVTARGIEDADGYAGNWNVTAYAICGAPPYELRRVSATSRASTYDDSASVSASCPTGTSLLGTGVGIDGAGGQARILRLRPNRELTGVTAWGLEDTKGTEAAWTLTAQAICAIRPAGLQRVIVTSPTNSFSKSLSATCPAGKLVLGGGVDVYTSTPWGEVQVDDLTPSSQLTSVTATGLEGEIGYSRDWQMEAYAICASAPRDLQRVSVTSGANSSNKSVTATCPAGKQVLGAGAEIFGGGGQVVIDDLTPNSGLTSVTAAGAEDESGTAANWWLNSYAICAVPPQGLQLMSATSGSDSAGKSANASCPSGKLLLGAGADVSGGNGQVVIDDLTPSSTLEDVTVTGVEDESGTAASWTVTAYAICAT